MFKIKIQSSDTHTREVNSAESAGAGDNEEEWI